ncbi:tRNA pseudouridine(38-40) synthase TruA [Aquibacillus rhizosphaerae]|uniref:tRNA pseudouridine synthase A n=1 Tax=Aquibacillus rhizosphaerae TaxID=3051431 RepID=A0ABT7L872_9BACI|nr:tRNA pseudouridine(38-40) synthase TruA [Aquibacillus sp. LR5S19]MDL4841417.1 tRNA pseudouridine(38-40) synthase TruA [Aquibacillus sp. LR5S19]
MKRIKCIIKYDGTNFSGYQVQPKGRTVQEELEKALKKIHKGEKKSVIASGRTDARVHALGQVIHFDTHLDIPPANWKRAFNAVLPEDIMVKKAAIVSSNFHARFDVVEKEYHYFLSTEKEKNVFIRNYAFHFTHHLDLQAINAACKLLEGEHDFSSFCAAKAGVKGLKVRTIYHASCYKDEEKQQIEFVFKGNGFLYNMVRILVGTLIEVGRGKRQPSDIIDMIEAKDRSVAGKTAPAQGLFLWNVVYNDDCG